MGSCISFTSYYYYYMCKQLNKRETSNTVKSQNIIKNNDVYYMNSNLSYKDEEKVNLLQYNVEYINDSIEITVVRERAEHSSPKLETQNSVNIPPIIIPLEKKEYIKGINYHVEDDFELV